LFHVFPVNHTEVYHSPGKSPVWKTMHQLRLDPNLKDETFILTIRQGGVAGDAAMLELYSSYCSIVKAQVTDWISHYSGCKSDAQDIVHDAFIVMIHKIQYGSIQAYSLKKYWLGVAKKLIQNCAKKNDKIILVEEPESPYGFVEPDPETLYLIREKNDVLQQCMLFFGSRCRDVLILWASLYTMDEIAARMQLSSSAMARKIKHSCFKKLKNLVIKNDFL